MKFSIVFLATAAGLTAQVSTGIRAGAQNLLILPHYALDTQWQSFIRVTNASDTPQPVTVTFFGIHGMREPVTIAGSGTADNFVRTVPANGVWDLQPTSDSGLLVHGAVVIQRQSAEVVASVLFRSRVSGRPDFESGVPGILPGNKFKLSFDNTNGYSSGLALQNLDSLSNLLNVTIYDENGAKLFDRNFTGLLELAPNDRLIFAMADRWAFTAGKKGTIVFENFRPFAAMGLLFNPGGAFTALTAF